MIMEGGGAGGEGEGHGRKRRTSAREKEREGEKKTKGRIPNLFHLDVLPYMFTACPYSYLLPLPEIIC
jgi:hypothetical protein